MVSFRFVSLNPDRDAGAPAFQDTGFQGCASYTPAPDLDVAISSRANLSIPITSAEAAKERLIRDLSCLSWFICITRRTVFIKTI